MQSLPSTTQSNRSLNRRPRDPRKGPLKDIDTQFCWNDALSTTNIERDAIGNELLLDLYLYNDSSSWLFVFV